MATSYVYMILIIAVVYSAFSLFDSMHLIFLVGEIHDIYGRGIACDVLKVFNTRWIFLVCLPLLFLMGARGMQRERKTSPPQGS